MVTGSNDPVRRPAMRICSFILVAALGSGLVGCLSTASSTGAGDQAAMDSYAAGFAKRQSPFKPTQFRWPNGKGSFEQERLVEISRVDSRTSAFGKREIKCRMVIETSRWETVDGARQGEPKISRKTEERWLPAE